MINYSLYCEQPDKLHELSEADLKKAVFEMTDMLSKGKENVSERIQAYSVLCLVCETDLLSLKERWSLFCMLEHVSFVSGEYDSCDLLLRSAYLTLFSAVRESIPKPNPNSLAFRALGTLHFEKAPVVIVSRQMLGIGHAPTRRVLDYATTIQKKLGIPVVIVNEGGLHIGEFPFISAGVRFNFVPEYSNGLSFGYKDIVFPFYQNPLEMPDLQAVSDMVAGICALNPRLVLNVGGACITADLCTEFTKSAATACNTRIAVGACEYLVLWRDAKDTDCELFSHFPDYQKLVTGCFNYIMPDESSLEKYTRLSLGIPEKAFVAIAAGNRLSEETDHDFMLMIDDFLSDKPDAYMAFLGDIPTPGELTAGLKNVDRFLFLGAKKDGSQVIRLANVLIQPTRKGGARAAFEALFYGLPVITTGYGDTSDVAGADFIVADYGEMKEKLCNYYNDASEYAEMSEKAGTRGKRLEDMEGTLRCLFEDLEVI